MQLCTVAVALVLWPLVAAEAATVQLIDSQHGSYLRAGRSSKVPTSQLANMAAALTGLQPGQQISSQASKEVDSVVKPSPFKKPAAYVVLNLAGLEEFPPTTRSQHVIEDGEQEGVLETLLRANPDLGLQQLEQLATQVCQGNDGCLEQLLDRAAHVFGGQLDGQSLTLDAGVQLDLRRPEEKLFATELASTAAGLQQLLQQLQEDPAQDVVMIDATILGLQSLTKSYGQDSKQATAGKAAVNQLLGWMQQQLDTAVDGDYIMQVALLDGIPDDGSYDSVASWKQKRRSRMLQAVTTATTATGFPGPDQDQVAQAKVFSAKAAGYGGFVLMLYFMIAGTWCLCFMPFKRDSLLYGSKKTD